MKSPKHSFKTFMVSRLSIPTPPSFTRQRGTVLITVILVVAFVAILVVELNKTVVYQANLNRNLLHRDQAYSYLIGMEEIAKIYLKKAFDAEKDDVVNLGQPWAGQNITFPIDGGVMSASVTDMQSCLNLNSITILDPIIESKGRANSPSQVSGSNSATANDENKESITEQILTTLIEKLVEDTEVRPSALSAQVRDWIDPDFTPSGPDGAEDLYYQGLTIPYLPPNSTIAHVSELRSIRSFNATIFELVRDHICVLPDASQNKLNVNTIPAERSELLYAALDGKVSDSEVKKLISERPESGYSMQEFWTEVGSAIKIKKSYKERLDVTSRYFQMDAKAEIETTKVYLKTLFYKEEDNTFKVVSRYFGKE
ncbi:MAG: type II secretion system minor pseudopilin GspK [Kangiellaceae bacterium]|nr:type II secretion system minor pseudopilin GspK [Kangiellaceae bacterium]